MNGSKAVLSALLVGVLTALSCAPAAAPTPKPLVKVKLGIPGKTLDYLPLWVASERGFWKEEGIELDLITHSGGSEAKDVLWAGDTDVASFGVDLVFNLKAKGADVRVIGALGDAIPWALVAHKDLGIKSPKELKGKSIGVSRPGSLTHVLTNYILKQNGLDPEKDATIVGVGTGLPLVAALKGKKVDAAMAYEPFLSQMLGEGVVNVLFDLTAEMKGYSPSHLIVKKTTIDKNPQMVEAVRRALDKALKYTKANKEEAFKVAKKEFPETPEAELKSAFEKYHPTYLGQIDYPKKEFEFERDVIMKIGFAEKGFTYEETVWPLKP